MADSKRRILLIALGTTPHLLTFTLAALYKESPEAMPTEIRIVTTELGAEMARRSFFGEGNILDAFWRDYGLSPAAFTEADIHAISSADGEPIADIRTLDDSNRAADLIVKLVRECCEDPDASLHVSIVGGRKSMGMLMGSALTFYGRDRDRISHTLSENETAPDRTAQAETKHITAGLASKLGSDRINVCMRYQRNDGTWSKRYTVYATLEYGWRLNELLHQSLYKPDIRHLVVHWRKTDDYTVIPLNAGEARPPETFAAYRDSRTRPWELKTGWDGCRTPDADAQKRS